MTNQPDPTATPNDGSPERSDVGEPRRVHVEVVDHVGWLSFDRPPVNAFDWAMVEQVLTALGDLEADHEVRVIVLASANERYFSAGADLEVFRDLPPGAMARWCDLVHAIVRQLRSSSKPVLAALRGVAVGGGLEMTLHCDLRFASTDTRLGQPEINIDFIPPVGATQALVRLIGRPAAMRYLYDGTLLDAATALRIGLLDEVVAPEALRDTVQAYAATLAAKPPEALAGIRRTINIGGGSSFEEGLAMEKEVAVALADTPNFREGVAAFLAKRPPQWMR